MKGASRRRHLRRPVRQHHRAQQPRRGQRRRHRDRELDARRRPRQHRDATTPAASWCSTCPASRSRTAPTRVFDNQIVRQQRRELRAVPATSSAWCRPAPASRCSPRTRSRSSTTRSRITSRSTSASSATCRSASPSPIRTTTSTRRRSTSTTTCCRASATSRPAMLGALLISALGEIQPNRPYIVPDIAWDGVLDPARAPYTRGGQDLHQEQRRRRLHQPRVAARRGATCRRRRWRRTTARSPRSPRSSCRDAVAVALAIVAGVRRAAATTVRPTTSASRRPDVQEAVELGLVRRHRGAAPGGRRDPVRSQHAAVLRLHGRRIASSACRPARTAHVARHATRSTLPVGSVLVQDVQLPRTIAAIRRRRARPLETRVLVHGESGWHGASYVYGDDDRRCASSRSPGDARRRELDPRRRQRAHEPLRRAEPEPVQELPRRARRRRRPRSARRRATSSRDRLQALVDAGVLVDAPPRRALAACRRAPTRSSTGTLESARVRGSISTAASATTRAAPRARRVSTSTHAETDRAKLGVCKAPVATGRGSGGRQYDIVPGQPDASIMMFRIGRPSPTSGCRSSGATSCCRGRRAGPRVDRGDAGIPARHSRPDVHPSVLERLALGEGVKCARRRRERRRLRVGRRARPATASARSPGSARPSAGAAQWDRRRVHGGGCSGCPFGPLGSGSPTGVVRSAARRSSRARPGACGAGGGVTSEPIGGRHRNFRRRHHVRAHRRWWRRWLRLGNLYFRAATSRGATRARAGRDSASSRRASSGGGTSLSADCEFSDSDARPVSLSLDDAGSGLSPGLPATNNRDRDGKCEETCTKRRHRVLRTGSLATHVPRARR